ncbi:hypothetical protein [Priestia megaterium]
MKDLIVSKMQEYISNETLLSMIGTATEYIPHVGNVLGTIKLNRAERRIKENREYIERLNSISGLTKISVEFYSEKILPLILEDFYEEHEDAKICYLLNGVYNIILEENHNESVIYNYLETLRNLHYSDMRRLFYLAKIDSHDYFSSPELSVLTERTDNKLEKEGLISLPISKTIPSHLIGFGSPDQEINQIRLTEYGNNFMNFVSEKI